MFDTSPTGSVTGRQGWEWNQIQADRSDRRQSRRVQSPRLRHAEPSTRAAEAAARPSAESPSLPRSDGGAQDEAGVRAHGRDRETDEELQAVIVRYESLLEEKNRKLDEAGSADRTADRTTAVIQAVRRLFARM